MPAPLSPTGLFTGPWITSGGAGVSEPARTALAGIQTIGLNESKHLARQNQHLGDPVAGGHEEQFVRVRVAQDHTNITSIAGVDNPWGVQHMHPVFESKPGPLENHSEVPAGDRKPYSGRYERPSVSGSDSRVFGRTEIDGGVPGLRVRERGSAGTRLDASPTVRSGANPTRARSGPVDAPESVTSRSAPPYSQAECSEGPSGWPRLREFVGQTGRCRPHLRVSG